MPSSGIVTNHQCYMNQNYTSTLGVKILAAWGTLCLEANLRGDHLETGRLTSTGQMGILQRLQTNGYVKG
jgi:hypothetical protein